MSPIARIAFSASAEKFRECWSDSLGMPESYACSMHATCSVTKNGNAICTIYISISNRLRFRIFPPALTARSLHSPFPTLSSRDQLARWGESNVDFMQPSSITLLISCGIRLALYWLALALCSKTRGIGAGRKLKNHRRAQLWADKDYKKSHLGNEWKKPFQGASHAKGIVLEKM